VSNDFQPIAAKGGNGQIYFDGKQVKIIRDGFAGRMTVGKGAKSIPLSSITAVRFRGASFGVKGFAQFSIMGDVSIRGNLSSALLEKDENTIMLHSASQSVEIKKVVDAIELAIANQSSRSQIPAQVVVQEASKTSYLDELLKLADLRDRGVFTEEEFQAEKAKLMSQETRDTPSEVVSDDSLIQHDDKDVGGFLWILSLPAGAAAIFDQVDEILGLPRFAEGIKPKYQTEIISHRKQLIDMMSLIAFGKSNKKPARLNRKLSSSEAEEMIFRLRQIGVAAELRQD
jgi:hypothetical protein